MFRLLEPAQTRLIEIELDGASVRVPAAISVAAALLYLDSVPTRHTPVLGSPRAPFCMIGACFECLVEIDGVGNERGCQVEVYPGMRIRRQLHAPPVEDR